MTAQAFDTGVLEMAPRLRSFIRRRVPDDATADDLTQETLLKVYRSREALQDSTRLDAWLYRVARTTVIDYYRRRRPNDELPADLAGEPPAGTDQVTTVMMASVRRFLEQLPERYREPVRLAEFEELPLARIALRLGLSLTAVKSRVRRGRAMLKKKLQDCCRFEFDRYGKIIDYERRQKPTSCGPACAAARRN
jgi:RNA polymerase sigma-70 factor (ECF subfamily)